MPMKNNMLIYDDLFRLVYVGVMVILYTRPIILEHGIWDQVRIDCGREFALMLYVQHSLSSHRYNAQRAPYLQTTSTMV